MNFRVAGLLSVCKVKQFEKYFVARATRLKGHAANPADTQAKGAQKAPP